MFWIPMLIALLVGIGLGAAGMFVYGPRRAAPGGTRSLPAPASMGALPFSGAPISNDVNAVPRQLSGGVSSSSGVESTGVPEGSFESEALEALVEYMEASGVSGFKLKYEHNDIEHLRVYRGSWSGSMRFGGVDRKASISVTVYKNEPDEIWYSSSIEHGVELGRIPYLRADRVEGDAWLLQRADEVPSALAIAAVRSVSFQRVCAQVAEAHDPASADTRWALTLTSEALMPVYRARGGGHSPLAFIEGLYESFQSEPFSVPTRAELEQMLDDPGENVSVAREVARHLIDSAPSAVARASATQLALAHGSSDVRLTAAVDVVRRSDGSASLAAVAQTLTEVQAAAPTEAISGEVVVAMLGVLEEHYPEDEYTPYVAALLGALTYSNPSRLRAVALARPLIAVDAAYRDEPGVRTFAERILGELTASEDLDAYVGWMHLAGSAYYTGLAFTGAVESGGLDLDGLERVLSAAHSRADGDFYVVDLFGRVRRAGEPCEGWRRVVWDTFGFEWVDARISELLAQQGDTFEADLAAAVLLGGSLTMATLRELSAGRGPWRAEAEEALARLEDRAVTGGLSVAEGGVVGGLSDASASGGLSDA